MLHKGMGKGKTRPYRVCALTTLFSFLYPFSTISISLLHSFSHSFFSFNPSLFCFHHSLNLLQHTSPVLYTLNSLAVLEPTYHTMATSGPAENDVFQQFRDKTKNELAQNVKAHRIGGGHYLYWSDIQRVFCDVDHLEKFLSKDDKTFRRGDRVLYEVSNGSL